MYLSLILVVLLSIFFASKSILAQFVKKTEFYKSIEYDNVFYNISTFISL